MANPSASVIRFPGRDTAVSSGVTATVTASTTTAGDVIGSAPVDQIQTSSRPAEGGRFNC